LIPYLNQSRDAGPCLSLRLDDSLHSSETVSSGVFSPSRHLRPLNLILPLIRHQMMRSRGQLGLVGLSLADLRHSLPLRPLSHIRPVRHILHIRRLRHIRPICHIRPSAPSFCVSTILSTSKYSLLHFKVCS
jgi:hypothetical protein